METSPKYGNYWIRNVEIFLICTPVKDLFNNKPPIKKIKRTALSTALATVKI